MVAQNRTSVKNILIGSYFSTFGLPDGEQVEYHCAWDADSADRLYDTESIYPDETARLVAEHYPDALLVAEISPVEKGARL